MPDTSNRTFVCSVLFLDIVEYSKKPVAEQLSLKQRFNALLLDAVRHVATADRIVLDTGDGAAVSFLGNPEDCLFAAMALRDAIAAQSPDLQPPLSVRIGINLGPVRLLKDINGQLNMIGDGINVAQRVMSFAEPGAILVSRSYFEVVSCLSGDIAHLFQYGGTRTDKHVREHSLYAIGAGTPSIARPGAADTSAPTALAVAPNTAHAATGHDDIAPETPAAAASETSADIPVPVTAVRSKRLWAAVAAAVLLVGGTLLMRRDHATDSVASANAEGAGTTEQAAPAKASVSLAILPWGEVYVDGEMAGVSPPLKSLTLTPGSHRIEIRNTTFPPHVQTVEAAGQKIKIRHKF